MTYRSFSKVHLNSLLFFISWWVFGPAFSEEHSWASTPVFCYLTRNARYWIVYKKHLLSSWKHFAASCRLLILAVVNISRQLVLNKIWPVIAHPYDGAKNTHRNATPYMHYLFIFAPPRKGKNLLSHLRIYLFHFSRVWASLFVFPASNMSTSSQKLFIHCHWAGAFVVRYTMFFIACLWW